MSRPSGFSESLAAKILERLAGGESLRAICSEQGMPHRTTVARWMDEDTDFAAKCARAREEQAEFHHEEMDRLEAAIEAGALPAQAGSVILANKRWRMEKLKPKVYGARLAVDHGVQDNLAERLKAARERSTAG